MAKRKTSCGNVRKCLMLLTNVTRSASYETLPNHRLFPARSGLTSRSPIRNRCLWHLRSNKSGDAVGRPSCRSSLLGDPGAKFLVKTGDPNRTMKNSLNYVRTCLRVVDTRRNSPDSNMQEIVRLLVRNTEQLRKVVHDAKYARLCLFYSQGDGWCDGAELFLKILTNRKRERGRVSPKVAFDLGLQLFSIIRPRSDQLCRDRFL